jgi:opacity protein-like surface antigen
MKNFGCFLVLTCVLAIAPVYAQSDVTLFGATQNEGRLNVSTATSTATNLSSFDPSTFGTFGVRFGHGKVFGGEHTFAYSPNFIEANTKAFSYYSNFMVQVPAPKIKPYATAGLGSIFTFGTDDSGRPSFGKIGTKFALNYGGGVKILPAGPVGLRFDIRGHVIPNVSFNIPVPTTTDPLATVKSESQTLNMLEAGVGIVFSFGER